MRIFILLIVSFLLTQQIFGQIKNIKSSGRLVRNIPSLRKFTPGRNFKPVQTRDQNGLLALKGQKKIIPIRLYDNHSLEKDPVAQPDDTAGVRGFQTPNTSQVDHNFDGIPLPAGGPQFAPGDPDLAVGLNHVIQMVNGSSGAFFQIFDKNGSTIINRTYMASLVAIPGYAGAGDGIVFYDHLADRYVMTEFGRSNAANYINTLVIAVSQTNDPTNGWNLYQFTDTLFLDYPKYGLWTDAYYATTNDFRRTAPFTYLSSTIWAFDRGAMLAGAPVVNVIKFRLADEHGGRYYSMAPVTLAGNGPPPPNTPGMIAFLHDDAWTPALTDSDSLGLISVKVDFAVPTNSQYNVSTIPVTPFKTAVNNAPTPGAGTVGVLNFRLMNRVTYRNFGTHQTILGTQTVDVGSNIAGIRWSELRKTTAGWFVHQEGTYGGIGTRRRFIGSIAMNSKGQMMLAYNLSSTSDWPSLAFTGRNANDPLGEMTYVEKNIFAGNGYGTNGARWGDYNSLVTDPANDSIFWFTAMYGSSRWKTRISSLKLPPHEDYNVKLLSIDKPVNGSPECISGVLPVISFRNAGNILLTSVSINFRIDNGPVQTINWTGTLPYAQTETFSLPAVTAAPGNHTMTIYTTAPNGQSDQYPNNDTAVVSFTIGTSLPLPLSETFENAFFPPSGWKINNPDAGSATWNRSTNAAVSGTASAYMSLHNQPSAGEYDYLVSPVVDITNADSVIIEFKRAYKRYSTAPGRDDTLMIKLSSDCGNSFPVTAWQKGGTELASAQGTQPSTPFAPRTNEWVGDAVDVRSFVGNSNNISVAFVSKSSNGQDISIDDINIRKVVYPARDVVLKPLSKTTRVCTGSSTPVLEIMNLGKDTLQSLKVLYMVDGSMLDSVAWTGSLPSRQSTTVTLKAVNLPAAGKYLLRAYTQEPNGLNDLNPSNDSINHFLLVFGEQPAPLKQGFEEPVFPLRNWVVEASNEHYSWEKNDLAASESVASLWVRNYRFSGLGKKDDLLSPIIRTKEVDTVLLKFDVAHITAMPAVDTLEVLLTKDCGNSFISVYKKWGFELQSINDPLFPRTFASNDSTGFIPTTLNQWRNERLDITKWTNNSKFQVVFRNSSNHGNNTFIDNINISAVTLPAKLKRKGYIITPNPFDGAFALQHVSPPVQLKALIVTNAAGQKVYTRMFKGDATNYISIDLSRYAAGVYIVKIIYTDKIISERIIKRK